MNEKPLDRRNYDVVIITSRTDKHHFVQDAHAIDPKKIKTAGNFIRVFADMFLSKSGNKAYF
jgi:hypothetical protein